MNTTAANERTNTPANDGPSGGGPGDAPAGRLSVAVAVVRWSIGLVLALSLVYPLLSAFVFISIRGYPLKWTIAALAALALGSLVVTWRLHRGARDRRWQLFSIAVLLLAWLGMTIAVGLRVLDTSVGDPLPLAALFGVSTLALPFAVWWFSWNFSFVVRCTTLVALLALSPLFFYFARFDGVAGDGDRFALTWRTGSSAARSTPAPHAATKGAPSDGDPVESTDSGTAVSTPNHEWRDYAQFLGPDRNAHLDGFRLDPNWQATPPVCLWRREVGSGLGAFAISGDRAVTQEQLGEEEAICAYHVLTGEPIWTHSYPGKFSHGLARSGPRATPTLFEGKVYAIGALGSLRCVELDRGELVWKVETLVADAENLAYGVAGSPLIVDDLVVVCPPGKASQSVAAYDRLTGAPRWSGGNAPAGYSSPVLAEIAGTRQIVVYNSENVLGLDPATGRTLWSYTWTNEQANCSQPIIHAGAADQIFVSTGYGKGSVLLRVEPHGGDDFRVECLWTSPKMCNKFSTPIAVGDTVYGLDDGILAAADLKTGNRLWKRGRYGYGQLLMIGNYLLVMAENGDLVLLEPSATGVEELGRVEHALDGKTWNQPAFAAPYLLIRNEHEGACFRLKCQPSEPSAPRLSGDSTNR